MSIIANRDVSKKSHLDLHRCLGLGKALLMSTNNVSFLGDKKISYTFKLKKIFYLKLSSVSVWFDND